MAATRKTIPPAVQFAFIFLVILAWALLLSGLAHAHSWYSKKTDPEWGNSCCGGSDCAMWAIEPGEISAEAEGIRVRLSLERTRTINQFSTSPIDALVTWNRVQPSEDGNWHLCIMSHHRDNRRGGIYCLFMPPNG